MAIPSRPHAFGMQDYRDLRCKLEWEIARYRQAQRDDDENALMFIAWNASVTAWQMVDWVFAAIPDHQKQAKRWEAKRDFVRAVLASSPSLVLCQQFANGSKHHTGDCRARHDIRPEVLAMEIDGTVTWILRIHAAGATHDLLQVLEEAWAFWECFPREHGIPAP